MLNASILNIGDMYYEHKTLRMISIKTNIYKNTNL